MAENYDQNPLIQAIDAKRKAAEEAAEAGKVIHIFTKTAWVPPPEVEEGEMGADPSVKEEDVDVAALKVVTGVVEDFEAALLRGVALITYNQVEGCFEAHVSLPAGLKPADGAVRMLGSLKVLEDALLDIATNHVDVLAKPGSEMEKAFDDARMGPDEDDEA